MLTDIVVIDDVFDDPDSLVRKARELEYYDRFNHPQTIKGSLTSYAGFRTNSINELDKKLYTLCNDIILSKLFSSSFGNCNANYNYSYSGQLYFHYLTDKDIFNENWLHRDDSLCAGVVYLKKNPPPNTGTILMKGDKRTIIENKYNRLVLYNANIVHSVQNGFGKNVYDGRLTLTIFYKKLSFNMVYTA